MTPVRKPTVAALGLLAIAGTLGVAACAGGDPSADGAAAGVGEGTRGGVYRVATTDLGFNGGFDPTGEYLGFAWGVQKQLLIRSLTGYRHTAGGPGTEILPDLATEIPTPTNGGRTWTFRLKDGVRFGPPVSRDITSRDVAYAFERIATPSVVAQYGHYYQDIRGWQAFSDGTADTISGIATPDARTIVFTLTKPVGDFPYRLALPATAPIPREVAKCFTKPGEYGRYLISSGPYMLKGSPALDTSSCDAMKPISGFSPTRGMSLVRNPEYDPATDSPEQREALPDGFEFVVNTNEKDIFDKIEAGEYDGSVDPVPADVARRYSRDDAAGDRLRANPDDGTAYIFMNLAEAPFDDVNVRRATNLVMDKSGLQRAWGGAFYGRVATHIAPPSLYGDDPAITGYDPYPTPDLAGDVEAAKAEMRKSAYDTDRDGVCDADACRGVLFVNQSVQPYVKMTPVIRQSLEKIGIRVDVRELPTGAAYETTDGVANRVQIGSNGRWGKDYPDPSTFLGLFDGRNLIATGNSGYSLVGLTPDQAKEFGIPFPAGGVPSVDDDLDACAALVGPERRACWIALEKTLMETVVPWVPYLWSNNTDLLGPAVTAWDYDQFSGEAAWAHVAVDPSRQR